MSQTNNVKLPEFLYLPVIKNKEGVIIGYGEPGDAEMVEINIASIKANNLHVGDTVELIIYKNAH